MPKTTKPKSPTVCNFCQKHKDAVLKLIIGDNVGICNECVDFCVQILKDTELKKDNINLDPIIIKEYLDSGNELIKEGYQDAIAEMVIADSDIDYSDEDKEIVKKIKELIDTYVRPAVEMDGGNIEFKSFDKGIVNVILQGSCSGCPSATVTLKSGIEGMLKRMVPQVTEVVSEMG